jgi:hypothetical protein
MTGPQEKGDGNGLGGRRVSCPVCGIALIESDLDGLEGEYFCPYCITELRLSIDSSVPGLQIGWAPGNVAEQIR